MTSTREFEECVLRLVVVPAEPSCAVVRIIRPDSMVFEVNIDDSMLLRWREGPVPVVADEMSAHLWSALEPGVSVVAILNSASGYHYDTIRIVDIEVQDEALSILPWEDLRDTDGSPLVAKNVVIRRNVSSMFPRISATPMTMPWYWLSVGDSDDMTMPKIAEQMFNRHGYDLDEIEIALQSQHVESLDTLQGRADILHLNASACKVLMSWDTSQSYRLLADLQVRLLVLDPPYDDLTLRAALIMRAQGLINMGGPGIMISRGKDLQRFYQDFYDGLVHDLPVELTTLYSAYDSFFPILYLGYGRGHLIRPSHALTEVRQLYDELRVQSTELKKKTAKFRRYVEEYEVISYDIPTAEVPNAEASKIDWDANLETLSSLSASLDENPPPYRGLWR
ncbi:MAG: hypothetical protein JXA33_22710 [Anaerolineae bacterium]|nr:hypothetical protein [Anaerolineae bacterium]